MNMASVRYVLFDAVGTIIRPRSPVAEVYEFYGARRGSNLRRHEIAQRLAEQLGRREPSGPIDEQSERDRWRRIVDEIFTDVREAEPYLFQLLWSYYGKAEAWQLYEDVVPAWQAIEATGRSIGIASNFDARLRDVCRGTAPLDRCAHLFISSEIGYAKPDPRFWAGVQDRLQAAPDELLLIGNDADCDYAGARAAGWHALLIDRDAAPGTPGVITDLREIVALL